MENYFILKIKRLCFVGINCEDIITSLSDTEMALEGDSTTLSCKVKYSFGDSLQWYRQYPKSAPQLLIMQHGEVKTGITLNHDKDAERLDLSISSAEVTDSALYYCAVRPTVTETPGTLHKNLTRSITGTEG